MGALDRFFSLTAPFTVNTPATSALLGYSVGAAPLETLRDRIWLPPGFEIQIYVSGLRYPRGLHLTPTGALLVSQPWDGRVLLLEPDADADGAPDGQRELVSGLRSAQGMDYSAGWLYLGETDAIARIRFDPETGTTSGSLERIAALPATSHWVRNLRVGPDGWIYTGVGANCNVCEDADPRVAAILRFRPDGSGGEVFASGIRNAAGFDWDPETLEMYATDAGRDLLGDDLPPEELNRLVRGASQGFPYAHGQRVADPEFGVGRSDRVRESLPPVHEFAAHTTPLGLVFLRGANLPDDYRGAALVALHGSWNRTAKAGYKVVSLHRSGDRFEQRDFAAGFELADQVIGRPVDVAEGPDGAIYVSDDYAGAIYRITSDRSALSASPRRRGGRSRSKRGRRSEPVG